jgi:hypothetical protein
LVHRYALALLVALLAFSASGVTALVVQEPCTGYEQTGQEDADCAPTCLTCGCCAQPVEPVLVLASGSPDVPPPTLIAFVSRLIDTQPRGILHVPKVRA